MINRILKAIPKRFSFIAIHYLLFIASMNSQDITLKVNGILSDRVFLQAYHGSKLETIDIAQVEVDVIHFENKNYKEGLFRIVLGDPADAELFKMNVPAFDLIISPEQISLQTSWFNPVLSMKVIQSEDNNQLYKYLEFNNIYRARLGALIGLLSHYSEQDQFYSHLRNEIVRIQTEYNDYLFSLAAGNEDSFVSDYLKFMVEPVYNPDCGLSIPVYMKDNFLKPVDFNSPALIRSPVISHKILSYLSFYTNKDFSQAEQENEFIRAVDNIMDKIKYDQEVFAFVLDFLVEGFEKFQMESVLVHIADNYLSGECETDSEKILQERLSAYQEMSVGKQVKNIKLQNERDELVSMSDIQNEYTLILFWASWCPHCKKLISDLNTWYKSEAKLYDIEIFAVSIDTSKANWEEEVFMNDLSWINTIEPKGWDGKIAQQYNLYATPTMFLINRKKEIIAKPLTMMEFRELLKELY